MTLKLQIISAATFLLLTTGAVFAARMKTAEQPYQPTPSVSVPSASESAQIVEHEQSATPSAQPTKMPASTPIIIKEADLKLTTSIDCDLRPYGGTRSETNEEQCKANIRALLNKDLNIGKHCVECSTVQFGPLPTLPSLGLPQLDGSVDLNYDKPDYQKALDEFNKNVTITQPSPTPCVPVGDGFNCL